MFRSIRREHIENENKTNNSCLLKKFSIEFDSLYETE